MSNFINKTKTLFKGKPVRIIIALIIIAAIMTGVAFGIIALVNSLSSKCSNQSGTYWNNDLQKCIPRQCEDGGNVCKIKGVPHSGNCVSDDYCKTYKGQEYVYDPDSCECTINCSNSEEEPFTKDGLSWTKFTNGIPDNPLTCGIKCDYNPKDSSVGGNKWCPPNYLCGTSIASDGTNLSPDNGCFLNDGTIEKCGDSDNICNIGQCDPTTNKCKLEICSGKENGEDLYYACTTPKDCIRDGTQLDDVECKKDGKFQYYHSLGYCSKTNKLKDQNRCTTLDMLGEANSKGNYQPINCNKYKQDYPNVFGLAGINNPCDDSMVPGSSNACAKNGECTNSWQAKNSNITCRDGDPPSDSSKDLTLCCDNDNIANLPNSSDKLCCPIKAVKISDKSDEKTCSLNTKYGYSESILTNKHKDEHGAPIDLNKTIDCTSDPNICDQYNDYLWKNLGESGKNPLDQTDSKFSKMYCDKDRTDSSGRKKVCKAICGLFDTSGEELNSDFGVLNNDSTKHSYCFSKNQNCQMTIPTYKTEDGYTSVNGIPICTAPGRNPAWSSKTSGLGYKTGGITKLTKADGKTPCDNTEQACLNALGKNMYQINDISVETDGCKFTAACDKLPVTYEKDGKIKSLLWSELLDPDKVKDTPEDIWKEKVSQSPFSQFNQPGHVNLYYDNTKNCTGSTAGLPPNMTQSPLKFVSDTNGCTKGETLKLTNDGQYCEHGVNSILNSCNPNPNQTLKTENFENTENLSIQNIYGAIHKTKPSYANITDDTNNYFCGYLGLKTDDTNTQTVTRVDDKATIYLKCSDDGNNNTGTIRCVDHTGAETSCCQRNQYVNTGKLIYNGGNNWECTGFIPDPNSQYKDYYQCTNSDDNKVKVGSNTYSRTKIITQEEFDKSQGKILTQVGFQTSELGICDLKGEKIKASGNGKKWDVEVCDAIKWNGNGCGDLDHSLGHGRFKDGWLGFSNCRLNELDIPLGVNAMIMDDPGGAWCSEKYMCQTDGGKCAGQGNVPPGVFKNVGWDNPDRTAKHLDKNTCSVAFSLGSKNPYACS